MRLGYRSMTLVAWARHALGVRVRLVIKARGGCRVEVIEVVEVVEFGHCSLALRGCSLTFTRSLIEVFARPHARVEVVEVVGVV